MSASRLIKLWKDQREFLDHKSYEQLINMTGDGILKDSSQTSMQIREFLNEVSSEKLKDFVDVCLNIGFKDSGLALQELVNQFGKRLGFDVIDGLYRGKKNDIGFDGLWHLNEDHSYIIEVKTTDAYRINLNTLNVYKQRLEERGDIEKNKSSILIVVGRQDTGDLEAQIRGSKFAWNMRLISVDSLIRLIGIRENVNDNQTINQINEILKPLEFTRLDRLIELIYLASEEDDNDNDLYQKVESDNKISDEENNSRRVKFNDACVEVISNHFNKPFYQQSKSTFYSSDKSLGLSCAVSKIYPKKGWELYWFAFHQHHYDFLSSFNKSHATFGCGSSNQIIMIPFHDVFIDLIQFFGSTTKKNGKKYWHIKIHKKQDKIELEVPSNPKQNKIDITKYLLDK